MDAKRRVHTLGILAFALTTITIAGCGGSSSSPSLPPAANSSSTHAAAPRHAMGTSGIMTAVATLTSRTGSLPVAGQDGILTITLAEQGGVYPQDWPSNFTWWSPFNDPYQLPIYFEPEQPLSNTCTGLAVTTPLKYATTLMAAGSTGQMTGKCQFSMAVVPGTIGSYNLNTAKFASWTPDSSSPNQLFEMGGRPAPTPVPVAAPPNHVYVPIQTQGSVPGNVVVFSETPSVATGCTISNAAIPNPIAVAVNPHSGNIYVLDKSDMIAEFPPMLLGCPTSPRNTWSSVSGANTIAVDQSDAVLVANCSTVATYPAGGGTAIATQTLGIGTAGQMCVNELSSAYWDGGVYATERAGRYVDEFNLNSNGTLNLSAYQVVTDDGSACCGSMPGPWQIAAIGTKYYWDAYTTCNGIGCNHPWGYTGESELDSALGMVETTGGAADYNASLAYDAASGWLVDGSGSVGSGASIEPRAYKPSFYESNAITSSALEPSTYVFPAGIQMIGIAAGP